MADQIKSRYIPIEIPPQEEKPSRVAEGVGTATRVATGTGALPAAIRVGSGLASGFASKLTPVATATTGLGGLATTAIAAGLGGGGELLAQLIEGGWDPKKLNLPRVGIEAGISAVPFGREMSKASAALKGGTIATAGIVGRKATSENPKEELSTWSPWDAAQIAGGAALGSVFGKGKPAPKTAPQKHTIESLMKSGKWSTNDVERTIARAEALGDPDTAQGLRIASAKTDTGNTGIYQAAASARNKEVTQEARNLNATEKFIEKGWQQEARNANAKQKYLAGVAKETDAEALRIEAQRNKDWAQEAKNLNAKEAYERAQANAEAVEKRLAELGDKVKPITTVTKTSKMQTPEGDVKATTVMTNKPRRGGKGPATTPAADKYQIVAKNGAVMGEFADEASLEKFINELGPERMKFLSVVKPQGATAAAPKAPVGPSTGPTPAAPAKVPTKAPETPAQPFNPPKMVPAKGQAEVPSQTPVEAPAAAGVKMPTMADAMATSEAQAAKQQLDAKAAQLKEGFHKQADALKVKAPLSEPLAKKVAEAQTTPEGTVVPEPFVRFFRNPKQAEMAQSYNQKMTDEQIDLFNPVLSQYEAQARKSPNARLLGELLSRMRDDMGWPRQARNLKSQTPKAPTTTPAAPVSQEADALTQEVLARQTAQRGTPADVPANAVAQELEAGRQADLAGWQAQQQVSNPAPAEILSKVEEFKIRREQMLNAAKSPEEAQQIASQLEKEANDLQLELALAERAANPKGTTLGFGLGGAQDIFRIAQENPDFAARLASTGVGAGIGAYNSEEDPLSGALIGGSLGYLGAPYAQKLMQKVPQGSSNAPSVADRLVNWQRFALLSNPQNLAINIVAPTGGGAIGSIEKMLQGGLEKAGVSGDSGALELGAKGLKNVIPWPSRVKNFFTRDAQEANRLLHLEEQRADISPGGHALDRVMSYPARMMTAGDLGVRNALQDAGWSEDMARAVTVTSEPRYENLGKAFVNFARSGGALGRFLLPFSRTAANVVEGSLERTPILGLFMQKAMDNPELHASMAEVMARQGMGGLVSFGAYQLGQEIDPQSAKDNKVLLMITNLSGQYGALAAAAFLAGQASQVGATPGQQVNAAWKSGTQALPLPTAEPLAELGSITNLLDGQPVSPNAPNPIQRWVPDPLLPRILKGELRNPLDTVANYEFNFD